MTHLDIDIARTMRELEKLASISEAEPPVVTRVVFSEADRCAREYVKGLCAEAGLAVREDAVGNTFARWAGADPALPAIGTGSHIDAIPNAGKYDGVVGVLGGLEAIRALQRSGFRPRRSLELLIFTSEEPTRFGIGCLGSRLLSGTLEPSAAQALRDKDGRTLDELRAASRFAGSLADTGPPPGYYGGFVELHIEQGPILERENIPLGVVTAIAAPASFRIFIEGEGGHAGGMLMPGRRDAFLAAAEIALAVEGAAKGTGAVDTVGTVGVCDIFPRAVNSVPSRAAMEVDVRDIDPARRDVVVAKIIAAAKEVAARRRVSVRTEMVNADAPAQCDARLLDVLARACEKHQLGYKRMVSRAYHDSLFMARVAPVAMLFIPCRGGYSHRPDEYASPDAIAAGTLVLAETLAALAGD